MASCPPSFTDIVTMQERLQPYLLPTPLRSYAALDAAIGVHVLVKHENHQPTNSFKIRNGLAALLSLPQSERQRGVITASRGNHGAGVAWAGQLLKIPITVCVPIGNNPEKNEMMRGLGAEIVERGESYDEAVVVMELLANERGLTTIHSTNNVAVLEGAGTLSLEILQQAEVLRERIDAMVFAIGGGSQAAGAITVTRELQPTIVIYGAQSAGASATHESWVTGHRITRKAKTFADGIATATPYELTFQTLRSGLKDFVLVSEEEIAQAMRLLIQTTHNLAEGAGAAGLAGLIKLRDRLHGQTVVVVLSGANIDQQMLRRIISE